MSMQANESPAARKNRQHNERRELLIRQGRCGECAKPRERRNRRACNKCLEDKRKATRKAAAVVRAEGKCGWCRQPKPKDDHLYCEVCRGKIVSAQLERRKIRLKYGYCQVCGKRKHVEGLKVCRICSPANPRAVAKARRLLADKKRNHRAHQALVGAFKRYRRYFSPVQQRAFYLYEMAWPRLTFREIGPSKQAAQTAHARITNRLKVFMAVPERVVRWRYPKWRGADLCENS